MNKIIVPTDFSPGAHNALIHAIELAKKFDARLEIIHTWSMPSAGSTVMVDITDILEKNAKEELETFMNRIESENILGDVSYSSRTSHGSVQDCLERITHNEPTDLVVMGTRGADIKTDKWLGSNTSAVSKSLDAPLLVVPGGVPFKDINNVMFATDMKVMETDKQLEFLGDLVEMYNCKVNFVHIQTDEKEIDIEPYRAQIRKKLGAGYATFTIHKNSDIEDGLIEVMHSEKPDLLIAVRHKYGFFKGLFHSSTSQYMVNNSDIPVLVVTD